MQIKVFYSLPGFGGKLKIYHFFNYNKKVSCNFHTSSINYQRRSIVSTYKLTRNAKPWVNNLLSVKNKYIIYWVKKRIGCSYQVW